MKEHDVQKETGRLKEKIRILTEENETLTEKAEDIYLLGIISEKIGLESTEEKIIAIAVENIVTLKDISYCAFLLVSNNSLTVIDDYGPNISESLKGKAHDPGKILRTQFERGEYFSELAPDNPAPDFIPQFAGDHLPNSYCLVPVIVRAKIYGILLSVNCLGTSDHLLAMVPLLVQVGDIMEARLSELSFIKEIQEWNKTLELKVEERTARLKESEEEYRRLYENLKSLWGLAEQQESDMKTLSDHVLQEIISRSGSKYGFYGFMNEDESIFTILSWSREVMKDCQVHVKPILYSIDKTGIWADAVRKRKVILINDYMKKFPGKLATPQGHVSLTRVIAIPIFRKNKIVAVGAVANKETDYTEKDIKQLEGFLTSAQSIVDRKKAESGLLLFRDLVDRSNDAIFVIDPEDGKITDVNSKACKSLGYSREELLHMRVPDLDIRMQDSHAWSDHVQDVMGKGYVLIEGEHQRKDGTTFPVEINVNHFNLDEEEYMLAISRDVSERKKLEDELRKSHKLESVGILAGGIAHDFNNLLAAIQTNVFLSKMYSENDSKAYGRLEIAEKAIKRAAELTQQLMTFSRGGEPVKKTTSMGEIIKESCSVTLRGSNVKCEYSDSGNLWPVDVDEGQMSQVIHNLTLNADQSMPEGGEIVIESENVTIHSDAGLPLQEGRYVKIAIKDRGTGIAEEHRHKIFDPYFTTKEMGRGLGLAITYSIIKNHGGHITVESKLGAGTAFILYVPASEKQVEQEAVKKETLYTGKGKILIMDDEEMIRSSLGEMLSYIGYDVEYAKDGPEAIEIYMNGQKTSDPFDAVILDLTIPGGMGGEHTMKKLLEINPEVKAIVSSGYSNDPVMAQYRDYGFCDVIIKPFKSAEELSLILNRVINRAS